MTLPELHSLVQATIDALVEDTEKMMIGIRTTPDYCFCIRVAPDDVPRVIDPHGRTLQAIRTIVHAAAQQMGIKISVCVSKVTELVPGR